MPALLKKLYKNEQYVEVMGLNTVDTLKTTFIFLNWATKSTIHFVEGYF